MNSLLEEYLKLDKNPETNKEMQEIAQTNPSLLKELLENRLEFGTAGLRAQMGCGYSRMNTLTVIQASQGIAMWLKNPQRVVIGHDHRHHSLAFAQVTAQCFLSKGIQVLWLGLVHTPMVPWTVSRRQCDMGIMITASHNPKQDNGYKVYNSNGCQIISPADKEIAQKIRENSVPWPNAWEFDPKNPLLKECREEIDLYFEDLAKRRHFNQEQCVKLCYTAMHGVGYPFAKKALKLFGLECVDTQQQIHPDPDFPTVEYPNPEEGKGALKLAMETADANGCNVILANDPDADRLAVAESIHGKWKLFNGNEIGSILASFMIQQNKASKAALLTTTVSSHMIQAMAKKHGLEFAETLTGFKWLGNKAIELEKEGYTVLLAYEEAIGFMASPSVKDKDGVSALAIFSEWTNWLYSQNKTLSSYLDELYRDYGTFVTRNHYFKCYDPETIKSMFDKIRYKSGKLSYPESFGGHKIVRVRDLTAGFDTETKDNKPLLPVSASSQMLTFWLENGCIITLRTSGTEPKIKYYTELQSPKSVDLAKQDLDVIVDDMIEKCLDPIGNKLV
ncbi:hypothetical protein EDD86DRAFT_105365 [Gorgonomyces haynaldii]|nr:hypothetical protein EDD86DRAFT_105365 [Gorgonomyces haynaldii]